MDVKLKTDEAATTPALPPEHGAHLFLNRELSLLEFNRRVLEQAEDRGVPLLERLRFLCIVSSNLDEFFEVRVASLLAQYQHHSGIDDVASINLDGASEECRQIIARQYALLNDEILPSLSEHGIHLLRRADRNAAQKAWVKQYFDKEVRPLLTPVGLDPAHPFPRVINKSLNFIVELAGKDAFGRGTGIAIMKAPRVLPRVIRLPDELSSTPGASYCLLSSVIQAHGREQRPHFLVEVLLDPGFLGGVAVGAAQQVDAVGGQLREDDVVQQRVLARDDLAAFVAGAVQLDLARIGAAVFLVLGQQAGHAHLEELVEVAADDGQEAQPFEQGQALVFGVLEHAPVELQQRQLAIQERRRSVLRQRGDGLVRFQLHIHFSGIFHS